MIIVYGQWVLSNVLFVISHDGIRFARRGGQLVPWDAIETVQLDGEAIEFGIRKPTRWTERYPGWILGIPATEIVSQVRARQANK